MNADIDGVHYKRRVHLVLNLGFKGRNSIPKAFLCACVAVVDASNLNLDLLTHFL